MMFRFTVWVPLIEARFMTWRQWFSRHDIAWEVRRRGHSAALFREGRDANVEAEETDGTADTVVLFSSKRKEESL